MPLPPKDWAARCPRGPSIAAPLQWVGGKTFGLVLAFSTILPATLPAALQAQQLIGYVSTADAEITGAVEVMNGQAVLARSVSVTAKDHTAAIRLARGGTIQVCQTSGLRLREAKAAELVAPILVSLDRGAIEIQTVATASDVIATPDLRFTVLSAGKLDLQLRVGSNGDTCVETRAATGPTLAVSDLFGETHYELHPGQHVLFEHGSLREVVDHESIPCGCPPAGLSIADALLARPGQLAASPAEKHPFPLAESAGLTPETAADTPAVPPVQAAGALTYNAAPDLPAASTPAAAQSPVPASTPALQPAPSSRNPLRGVGHFFRRLFGGS